MTEESSTTSCLSVVMTTKSNNYVQTTGGNSGMLSSLGGKQVYLEWTLIFIGVAGVAGNALILYALVASKQHKKHVLIVNQNVLDLFSSFFLVVTYAVYLCNIHLTGVLGYWLCFAILSENIVWWGTNGSMVNLAIITIDRYLKVVRPAQSRKLLRPWVIHSAMAFAWFVGIGYNIFIAFYTARVTDGVCYTGEIFDSYAAAMVHAILYVFLSYFIMLAIFIFCYGRILAAIRRQASVMASHSTSGSSTAQTRSQQIQTNVIKTMILVSAFYAIAWLPYNVYYSLASTGLVPTLNFYDNAYYVVSFVAFFYTSANPFIYATKFNPVRKILVKMIPCKKNCNQPIDARAGSRGNRIDAIAPVPTSNINVIDKINK